MRELAEDGYSGVEIRKTPNRTEVIISATRTNSVLGEKGRRIRELTSVVQKRFGFDEGSVEVTCDYYSPLTMFLKECIAFIDCELRYTLYSLEKVCSNFIHPLAVRRKSEPERLMRRCPVRVVAIQAGWWTCGPTVNYRESFCRSWISRSWMSILRLYSWS